MGKNVKSGLTNGVTKVQQTGGRTMTGEEYDSDYGTRMQLQNMANMRKDQRIYGNQGDTNDDTSVNYKRRKNMRGRKGKYYSQVDEEDQDFLD